MFEAPVALAWDRRQYGQKAAVEILGDIHEYTRLYGPKEPVHVPYLNARQLFDFNEHFLEWGSPMRDRAMAVMLSSLVAFVALIPVLGFYWMYIYGNEFTALPVAMLSGGLVFSWFAAVVYWYNYLRAVTLTALCARDRFNRTTGKV